MNRIDARFSHLKEVGRAALIPYVTGGDPSPAHTPGILHSLVEGGADMIELGMPFSDPMADGPVIQLACERALAEGASLKTVLENVTEFRRKDQSTPLILMGYMNPIERFGPDQFLTAAAQAGVDGLLIVDLPPEEADQLNSAAKKSGLHQIFLVAPTTSPQRLDLVVRKAAGFVYYVSFKGITGAAHLATDDVAAALQQIRAKTDLPIGVGFGIKNAEDATRVAGFADAVVIGSALVESIHRGGAERCAESASTFLSPIRQAMETRAEVTS